MSQATEQPALEAATSGSVARPAGLFRALERGFARAQSALAALTPDELNPLLHLGAAANTTLMISAASGILLLFFYVPAVDQAYESVLGPLAGFLRTLHRYSSDACMLLVLLHLLKTFAAARFAGARWVAWFTGVGLLLTLWLDGWLGYWMLWDEGGAQTAMMSAAMVDALGLFSTPLSRGFAAHSLLNSLLFFVVFFCHIAIPLLLAAGIWLHLLRISKPRLLTNRPLTLVLLASLCAVSLMFPAPARGEADLARVTAEYALDPWYQAPLLLYGRVGEGLLWLAFAAGTLGLVAVPWLFSRRRRAPAKVDSSRCTGCEQCVKDCPFGANSMVAFEGRRVSRIDPAKCVGCGICIGSCSPAAIVLPELPLEVLRRRIDHWFSSPSSDQLAFVCRESAALAPHSVTAEGRHPELPGVRVIEVPCAGLVHPELVQRAQRRGAARVVVAACGADPQHRLGAQWMEERLRGERDPGHKIHLPAPEKLCTLRLSAFGLMDLKRATAPTPAPAASPRKARWVMGTLFWLALTAGCSLAGWITVAPASVPPSELVVTFLHSGEVLPDTGQSAGNEVAPHMRGARTNMVERAPVEMRVFVDGVEVVNRAYLPSGLAGAGPSTALERIPVELGVREIRIEINDTGRPGQWRHHDTRRLEFKARERHVARFDTGRGFSWE